ncbi:MAG: ATP-binding cassette domain-containing protein [Oscillochloris sp.]|nr:ATP-binding cassette domain-containing protein [Oscillochloris sp.]
MLAIQTEALTKRYRDRVAVDRLDLAVARGVVFGLLGPNGAGKTTTIAMLLGLVQPSAGTARIFDCDVSRDPVAALRRVGAMIETPALYPYLSAVDNLRVLAQAGAVPESRIAAVLDAVDLSERARDKVRTYSQGMRQRLAIAAALLPDPELIILDEPTNGLDPAGMVEIRALIRDLAAGGRTVLLCSHMLHEVEQVCQQVAILKAGRLIASGTVAEFVQRGHAIRVRIAGEVAPAAALIAALPWVERVEQQADLLLVHAPSSRSAELNTHLARNGVAVAELGGGGGLEEFFLEVTGEETNAHQSDRS